MVNNGGGRTPFCCSGSTNTMAKNGEETNKVARRAAAIEIAQSVLV
jgi:hypothetical protein